MKRKKESILLVLILAGLTAYLVFQQTERIHYSLPELPWIDKQDVSRITIRKGDVEFSLEREGDRWRILPEGYTADRSAVDRMLETLEGLRLTAMASATDNYPLYDLDVGRRVEVAAFKGDDLLVSLGVGKAAPSQRHTFVKLAGHTGIYHAEKNFRSVFDKDLPALRDKQVLRIDEEVSEILLTSGERSLHILWAPASEEVGQDPQEEALLQGTGRWETLEGKPVKGREVDALVRTLSHMSCEAYMDGEKESLGEPSFSVLLKGSKDYVFSLYETLDNKVVATSSESAHPFLIPDWRANSIRKDLNDLLEEKD